MKLKYRYPLNMLRPFALGDDWRVMDRKIEQNIAAMNALADAEKELADIRAIIPLVPA